MDKGKRGKWGAPVPGGGTILLNVNQPSVFVVGIVSHRCDVSTKITTISVHVSKQKIIFTDHFNCQI